MKVEQSKKFQFLFQALTSFGTIGIIISVCITYYGIKQNTEWNRRIKTVELIGDFDGQISKFRPAMLNYFPFLYFKGNKEKLDCETAEKLWRKTVDKSSKFEFLKDSLLVLNTRNQIVGLFNYLEYLSQAYLENTVDKEIFERSLSGAIVLYYNYFESFVAVSQKELDYANWEPVANFVKLMREKPVVPPRPPKSGP
jgi:hypothetical protein